MNLNRRSFFGVAAGGAVAAPTILPEMAKQAATRIRGEGALIGKYADASYAGEAPSAPPEGWDILNKAVRSFEQKAQRHIQFRVGNIDADIASLRLPRATLQRMQMQRDDGLLSTLEKLQKQLSEFRW